MTQPESKVSRQIMNALRAQGFFCFKVHGGEHMMSGLPDIVVCANGLFIGLETKMPDKRKNTSARQDLVHEMIRHAGGVALVVCSASEALSVVQDVVTRAGVVRKL